MNTVPQASMSKRRGRRGRKQRERWEFNSSVSGQGLLHVGNATLESTTLYEWLEARHRAPCTFDTPIWFAPFSPNGIGNKLMGMVMAFHMALSEKRTLVVTDWPPSTLKTNYALNDIMHPSSCQALFDADTSRPTVRKCTVEACPLNTASHFRHGYTQMHWAHQSNAFLDVPRRWAERGLSWLEWWRALTQYLFQPSMKLLDGLAATLQRTTLLRSPPTPGATAAPDDRLLLQAPPAARGQTEVRRGFALRFAEGVARWGEVRRPLIGLHVRMGDGCGDDKRGGCKYVASFSMAVRRLREAGLHTGTLFLATDREAVAKEAVAAGAAGFDVLALAQDRTAVERSHLLGIRRHEGDELLHLQLLDLGLLSQADLLAGVFASTFVKSALQLGHARAYITLDTFPWCPLLRCYWGWRDLCHNCELCFNQAGGGEACGRGMSGGYHTARGLRHALRDGRPARTPFRRYMAQVDAATRCKSFADHPLSTSLYDSPVMCEYATKKCDFAPHFPAQPGGGPPMEVTHRDASCAFRRFVGVDNAVHGLLKPSYGYGTAAVGVLPSLDECEARCCADLMCHSVVWLAPKRSCFALLTIAHGARRDDFCWRPTLAAGATTSVRLPGAWQSRAVDEAARVLAATSFVRTGDGTGPRVFHKHGAWRTPAGHEHPLERSMDAVACHRSDAPSGALQVSDLLIGAIPLGDPRPGKPQGRRIKCPA